MKFHRAALPAVLTLTTLLAACGQPPQQTAATARPIPATPPEAVAPAKLTDLNTTFPGGKKLGVQAVDKSVPIILVHGLGGWGRNEFLGVPYWGGLVDVQEDLRSLGYSVFTASVGPVSSNWDRAAELYAQIKGGCVDYGAAHAGQFGHTRSDPAKCYAGFYPQWDAQHPVNLVGHSMGGQTARMLVKLLEDGDSVNADGQNLYAGGRAGWVKNLMTIATPNDGSPAADNLQDLIPQLQQIIVSVGGALSLSPVMIYDFDLGQYGFKQQSGEGLGSYVSRVLNSPLMTSKDSAAWDLRPDGAKALNTFMGRSKTTKYFSWATNATSAGLLTGWAYPNPTMNAALAPLAYPYAWPLDPGLGNMKGSSAYGGVKYDSSWWPNDGIVPSKYMAAPIGQQVETYTGQVTLGGHWYKLGQVDGYDHLDIIGLNTLRDVKQFYRNQAAFLGSQH